MQLVRKLKLRLDEIFLHLPPVLGPTDGVKLAFPHFTEAQESEIWEALRSVFGLTGELLENVGGATTFPADTWKRGNRIHLEPSGAYKVQEVLQSK